MSTFIQKHWTSLLGVLFIAAAFVTLFKYSVDQGWITDYMKVGIGLLGGASFIMLGVKLGVKRHVTFGEIMIGLGVCVLYATLSFAGIFYELWSPLTLLLAMCAVTVAASVYAFKGQSRLLMNIALIGALLAPLMLRPETDQVFALFLYLLVLNVVFLYLGMIKGWTELKLVSFIGTWLLYIVYFIHFNPSLDGIWSMPIRYAIAAYAFYTIVLLASAWWSKTGFDGLDLYLNIANGILFCFWAMLIWHNQIDYSLLVGVLGAVYILVSYLVYRVTRGMGMAVMSYGFGGLLLLLIAISGIGAGTAVRPLISVLLWVIIAGLAASIGYRKQWGIVSFIAVWTWFFVGCYWYSVTWTTPRGEWFGVYIPFLNWAAVAWVLLAGLGFWFSRKLRFARLTDAMNHMLSKVYAFLAHLIVGGLLTRQIQNIFTEYFADSPSSYMQMALSVSWGIYALLLVIWAVYYREAFFRWFGAFVLVLVAIKAIFLDLSGQEALYKVAVLFILGLISFLISWVNSKWEGKREEAKEESVRHDAAMVEEGENEGIKLVGAKAERGE